MNSRKVDLGVLISGGGSNLQAIIDQIEAGKLKAEINVVISDKKDAFGLERARKHSIPAVHLDPKAYPSREEFDRQLMEVLDSYGIQLVILAGYMRILSTPFVRHYPHRIMNIHPALLPSFPGTHGQADALNYGVKVSGCTVHFVDEEVDHGPIIIQAAVPVLEDDTRDRLAARILKEEHRIYSEAIRLYTQDRLKIEGRRVRVLDEEP